MLLIRAANLRGYLVFEILANRLWNSGVFNNSTIARECNIRTHYCSCLNGPSKRLIIRVTSFRTLSATSAASPNRFPRIRARIIIITNRVGRKLRAIRITSAFFDRSRQSYISEIIAARGIFFGHVRPTTGT